jgi:hypothetical protein
MYPNKSYFFEQRLTLSSIRLIVHASEKLILAQPLRNRDHIHSYIRPRLLLKLLMPNRLKTSLRHEINMIQHYVGGPVQRLIQIPLRQY